MTNIVDSFFDRDVRADSAWRYLRDYKNAHLVDVRTDWERLKYGVPDLSGVDKQVLYLSFVGDDGIINRDFEEILKSVMTNSDDFVFFICKTGYRSKIASDYAFALGYKNSINILGGFEGTATTPGWKGFRLACGIVNE